MIETLGYIFAGILALIGALIVYQLIRALVLSVDYVLWLWGLSQRKASGEKLPFKAFCERVLSAYPEMIFYNGGISYSIGVYRWDGFGTGREKDNTQTLYADD
jgi:hypothetical protein